MEGDFPLSRYIYEGLSTPPSLFPNYISAFQTEINGGESSSLQFYGGDGAYPLFGSHPLTIDYSVCNPIGGYNETDLMEFQRNRFQQQQQQQLINGDYIRSMIVSGSDLDDNGAKMEQQQQLIPKSEPFDGWMTSLIEPTPSNMRSGEGSSFQNLNQLPVLCSLEKIITQGIPNTDDRFSVSEPALKRFRSSSSSSSTDLLISSRDQSLSNPNIPFLSLNSLFKPSLLPSFSTPSSVIPNSILARERRKMISDKIRCLEKLMPWDKKMNMASILEEAYKYIKFLQAQVSVLQAMPSQSSFISTSSTSSSSSQNIVVGGGLEKLNRQQLLKVLMSSPVAQTNFYSKGCCVYSLEQLILLKKIAAHRILLQQMLMARSASSTSGSSYSRRSLP